MTATHELPIAAPADADSELDGAPLPAAMNGNRAADQSGDRPLKDEARSCDFRTRMMLSPRELDRLRAHQEDFVSALAGRLSQLLRLDLSLRLKDLRTVTYQSLSASWGNPSHLTLFKMEPLPGVSVLEIAPRLGRTMVDRLMGGTGQPPESVQEMSEIERALLEQAVQLIIGEWCRHWARFKELKPVVLGYESNGRFVQTASSETMMLVIGLEATLEGCREPIQIGLPFVPLEGMVRQLNQSAAVTPPPAPTPAAPLKWNPCLDEVRVSVTAGWQGVSVPAREVLKLKVGDLLRIEPRRSQTVELSLGNQARFSGLLGTIAGEWAVEILGPVIH